MDVASLFQSEGIFNNTLANYLQTPEAKFLEYDSLWIVFCVTARQRFLLSYFLAMSGTFLWSQSAFFVLF
jgi:hypothetical protein